MRTRKTKRRPASRAKKPTAAAPNPKLAEFHAKLDNSRSAVEFSAEMVMFKDRLGKAGLHKTMQKIEDAIKVLGFELAEKLAPKPPDIPQPGSQWLNSHIDSTREVIVDGVAAGMVFFHDKFGKGQLPLAKFKQTHSGPY